MALVFAAALACDRGPDTEDNVRKALDQANIQTVEVEVDDEASTVRLQGTVGTMADRTRANEIATAVVGTSGRVLNELTVEALNGRSADDLDGQITDRLDQLLDSDPVLRERDVNVQVTNRMVAITGEVRTAEEKHKVDDLVRAAPGVKDVANGLQIRSQP
jgi:osmotically-inducible protein OsmY